MKERLDPKRVRVEQVIEDMLEEKRLLDKDSHDYHERLLAIENALEWLKIYKDIMYLHAQMPGLSRKSMVYEMAYDTYNFLAVRLEVVAKPSKFYKGPSLPDLKAIERIGVPAHGEPKESASDIKITLGAYPPIVLSLAIGLFAISVPVAVFEELGMEFQALVAGVLAVVLFVAGTTPLAKLTYAVHQKLVKPVFEGKGYLW